MEQRNGGNNITKRGKTTEFLLVRSKYTSIYI